MSIVFLVQSTIKDKMEIGLTTILTFLIAFIISFEYLRRRRCLPPGPLSTPIFGSVGFLWNNFWGGLPPHKAFAKASKEYGAVFSVWVGPKLMVVLNGYETIHKAFVQQAPDFNDRPNWISQIRNATKIGKGISWSNGTEWKKMRKFTLQHLRAFGYGTAAMEFTIVEEIDKVSKVLLDSNSRLVYIGDTLHCAISNVICSIVFGQKFEYDDHIFLTLLRMLNLALKGQGFSSVTNFLPEFMYPLFPKEYELIKERARNSKFMRDYFDELIQSHEETFDGSTIRDFLDYYIQIRNSDNFPEEEKLAKEPYFNKNNIYRVIIDLFLAGSETTTSVLQWCFLYFIEYPEIQKKCRQQIVEAIGERQVQLSDRNQLPYIDATIQEVLRLSNVVPLGVPRTNVERDIYIDGFRIPKRTLILANLYSAHMDPGYWEDPAEFNPERFLDKQGQLLKLDSFIPLSLGPRNCIGESLARMELFLFVSILLQRFRFERDDNEPPNDFSSNPEQFITLVPNKYRLQALPLS